MGRKANMSVDEDTTKKPDITTFYFPKMDLPIVLEPHNFYVAEARKRLLRQFDDIDAEAQEAGRLHLERAGYYFDPDRDDPADAFDQSFNEECSHWEALTEMHNSVIIALTAGVFHQFDKTLREKVIKELRHWCDADIIEPLIWNIGFPRLMELLDWIGIPILGKDFAEKINACRLVVNVYKHGFGDAHNELLSKYPEYYDINFSGLSAFRSAHQDLKVSEAQFIEFANSIACFWRNIPEYCKSSQWGDDPKWLAQEIKKYKKRSL